MKNIILLILVLLSIEINAYEFLVYSYSPNNRIRVFRDDNGRLVYTQYQDGIINNISGVDTVVFWSTLNSVRINQTNFVSKERFIGYFSEDLLFVNDLYIQSLQQMLNFLYNDSNFSLNNHIQYENYELLYNSDGLAVASIVNGRWAGLYDNVSRSESGYLYNSNGSLLYVDGVSPSFFQKISVKLFNPLLNNFMDANALIPLYIIMVFLIVFTLIYFSIKFFQVAIRGKKWTI